MSTMDTNDVEIDNPGNVEAEAVPGNVEAEAVTPASIPLSPVATLPVLPEVAANILQRHGEDRTGFNDTSLPVTAALFSTIMEVADVIDGSVKRKRALFDTFAENLSAEEKLALM